MSILSNIKIRHKLTLIIMLACITVIIIIGAAIIMWTQSILRDSMLRNLSTQVDIMADNCKASIVFNDPKDTEDTLSAFRTQPSVIYACIRTDGNKIFASYSRDEIGSGIELSKFPPEDNFYFGDDFLIVSKSIVLDGDRLGTVYIKSDLSYLSTAFKHSITVIISVLVVALIVAYFLSLILQGVISNPILNLANVAKTISEEKKYSIRASKRTDDEIGLLIDSFNEMLEQIHQRDVQLLEINENLEEKVNERTVELTDANEQLKTNEQQLKAANQKLRSEITERERAEAELQQAQEELVETAHRAGMAEVATDVLHNVGNILNSINVSTTLVKEKVSNSKLGDLEKVANMINENIDDIGTFLVEDSRGKHIPVYLAEISKFLNNEQADISKRLQTLVNNVEHIKEIINRQQSYANVAGVLVPVFISELVEDAIQINNAGIERHGAHVVRELDALPMVEIDKHRVLQILVNLISNAKYALSNSGKEEKVLKVRLYRHGESRLRIEVVDNGVGISEENLTKIFNHGFTTKPDGHGFGLHNSALAATEMGGSLTALSDGEGQGATFTLELPFKPVEAAEVEEKREEV